MAPISTYDAGLYDTALYDGVYVGQPLVELYINGVWTDISAYVRIDGGIRITRGRPDEASSPQGAQCTLTLDNRDGRFSPRNSAGAYFGYIGRNTPLRVKVYDDTGTAQVRFHGVVSEWPVTWDLSGKDIVTTITADGPRRRLLTGSRPLQSPYRRSMASHSSIVAYWPMEDGDNATVCASALPGGQSMGFTVTSGSLSFAADDGFAASAPLPSMVGITGFTAVVPSYAPSASGQQVRMLFRATDTGASDTWVYIRTSGAHYFVFKYTPSTNTAILEMRNATTDNLEGSNGPFILAGHFSSGVRLSIELKQNGTGIDTNVVYYQPDDPSGYNFGVVTIPSSTLGRITAVQAAGIGTGMTTVIGHVTVENTITSIFDVSLPMLRGYAGETAGSRAARLATEEGVSYVVDGTAGTTMGAQSRATFLELWDEAADCNIGISTELVDSFGLNFRARTDLFAQSPVLALTYGTSPISALQPTDDDQNLQNDVTVTRNGGSSARSTATGVFDPTGSVGDYPVEYTLSLYDDSQCQGQADFRMSLGTVNEPRWPVIGLQALKFASASDRTSLIAMREGDLLLLTSVPSFAGAPASGVVKVLVAGWEELITENTWEFSIVGIPAAPYEVIVLDDGAYGILETLNRTIAL